MGGIRQGNMTPQKFNNNTLKDWIISEGDEHLVTDVR
jgi:hypothetical protein